MSTPVVTDQWSGNYECSGTCKRKRLMGEEFSKKAMERHLKQGAPLKCKQCVEQVHAQERQAAAARQGNDALPDKDQEHRVCAACQQSLPESSYNKNQWRNKPEGQSKCRSCVEQALELEQAAQRSASLDQLEAAQKAVDAAKTPAEILVAESRLSALQAQRVTGLKPVKMGRGGRGRGSGRGSGRSGGRGSGRSSGRGRSTR